MASIPQRNERRPARTLLGVLASGGGLGPAAAASTIRYPLIKNPSSPAADGYPLQVVEVVVLPGVAIAQDAAEPTTFTLQTASGTVIATGTNAGAGGITIADGLALTIDADEATVAAGTVLHGVIANQVDGQDLSANHILFQVRLQPA